MEDLVFYSKGIATGVVAPSTLFSSRPGSLFVNGPDAIVEIPENSESALHKALHAAGSLVKGTPAEVNAVLGLLAEPQTSRTASYLLCYAKNCTSLIADLKNLRQSRVLIVGCGGIGSSLAMLLAGAGIRKFCLVDTDVVERSNLNRQLFWVLSDVNHKKVDVLKRALEARFEDIEVDCVDASPGTDGIHQLAMTNIHGVAITADNPPTLAREGWMITKALGIPVVSGGYLHQICTSFHFVPDDCEAIEDAYNMLEEEQWTALPSAIMPSYGPMNFSLASALSSNLIASLAENTFGRQKTRIARWNSRETFQ
ncbi:ThiF family adenylyltransferase [Pseudomonas mosselii]|jgi:hypothetical protein|uniref:ThiF family adenylyltransferase n=1 Tax=unclassified Pseudomonas TaxID=196821 RepID=UPI0020C1D327|nr:MULTISPECIES: ThiF family adenylyltransferase [unclassified Pseudomonas]MCP8633510.1 ThiF family adenylyltransferase [Pseudomonas sp. DVZ6]MDC0690993.1 ThiF family adenylyltransferase [Mitsuaria sp. RG]MDD7784358.1 ThiF family adenylyltransferase [Pseudomonas sp. DVZ24]